MASRLDEIFNIRNDYDQRQNRIKEYRSSKEYGDLVRKMREEEDEIYSNAVKENALKNVEEYVRAKELGIDLGLSQTASDAYINYQTHAAENGTKDSEKSTELWNGLMDALDADQKAREEQEEARRAADQKARAEGIQSIEEYVKAKELGIDLGPTEADWLKQSDWMNADQEKYGNHENFINHVYDEDWSTNRVAELDELIAETRSKLDNVNPYSQEEVARLISEGSYNAIGPYLTSSRYMSDQERSDLELTLEKLYEEKRDIQYNRESAAAERKNLTLNKYKEYTQAVEAEKQTNAAYNRAYVAMMEHIAQNGISNPKEFARLSQELEAAKAEKEKRVSTLITDWDAVEDAKRQGLDRTGVEAMAKEKRNQAVQFMNNPNDFTQDDIDQLILDADALDKYAKTFVSADEIMEQRADINARIKELESEYSALVNSEKPEEEISGKLKAIQSETDYLKSRYEQLGVDLMAKNAEKVEKYLDDSVPKDRNEKERKERISSQYEYYIEALDKHLQFDAGESGAAVAGKAIGQTIDVAHAANELKKALVDYGFTQQEAEDYVENTRRAYNAIKAEARGQDVEEWVKKNGWTKAVSSVASVVTNIASGLGVAEALRVALSKSSNKTLDINSIYLSPKQITSTIREAVMESTNWNPNLLGKNVDWFDKIYSLGMSSLDSMAAGYLGALTGATAIGSAAIGMSAGVEKMVDMAERGATMEQAVTAGIVSGIFESLFETVSISQFNFMSEIQNVANIKDIAMNMMKSFVGNGSEELATELANVLYDVWQNYDFSDYKQLYDQYYSDYIDVISDPNINESERRKLADQYAKKMTAKDMTDQVIEAGVSGAFQGVFMGMGGLIRSRIRDRFQIGNANKIINTDFSKLDNYDLYNHAKEAATEYSRINEYLNGLLTEEGTSLTKNQVVTRDKLRQHLEDAWAELKNRDFDEKVVGQTKDGTFLIKADGMKTENYIGKTSRNKPNGVGMAWTGDTLSIGEWKSGRLVNGIEFVGKDGQFRVVSDTGERAEAGKKKAKQPIIAVSEAHKLRRMSQIVSYGQFTADNLTQMLQDNGVNISDNSSIKLSDGSINIASLYMYAKSYISDHTEATAEAAKANVKDAAAKSIQNQAAQQATQQAPAAQQTAPAQAPVSTGNAARDRFEQRMRGSQGGTTFEWSQPTPTAQPTQAATQNAVSINDPIIKKNANGQVIPSAVIKLVFDGKISYANAEAIIKQAYPSEPSDTFSYLFEREASSAGIDPKTYTSSPNAIVSSIAEEPVIATPQNAQPEPQKAAPQNWKPADKPVSVNASDFSGEEPSAQPAAKSQIQAEFEELQRFDAGSVAFSPNYSKDTLISMVGTIDEQMRKWDKIVSDADAAVKAGTLTQAQRNNIGKAYTQAKKTLQSAKNELTRNMPLEMSELEDMRNAIPALDRASLMPSANDTNDTLNAKDRALNEQFRQWQNLFNSVQASLSSGTITSEQAQNFIDAYNKNTELISDAKSAVKTALNSAKGKEKNNGDSGRNNQEKQGTGSGVRANNARTSRSDGERSGDTSALGSSANDGGGTKGGRAETRKENQGHDRNARIRRNFTSKKRSRILSLQEASTKKYLKNIYKFSDADFVDISKFANGTEEQKLVYQILELNKSLGQNIFVLTDDAIRRSEGVSFSGFNGADGYPYICLAEADCNDVREFLIALYHETAHYNGYVGGLYSALVVRKFINDIQHGKKLNGSIKFEGDNYRCETVDDLVKSMADHCSIDISSGFDNLSAYEQFRITDELIATIYGLYKGKKDTRMINAFSDWYSIVDVIDNVLDYAFALYEKNTEATNQSDKKIASEMSDWIQKIPVYSKTAFASENDYSDAVDDIIYQVASERDLLQEQGADEEAVDAYNRLLSMIAAVRDYELSNSTNAMAVDYDAITPSEANNGILTAAAAEEAVETPKPAVQFRSVEDFNAEIDRLNEQQNAAIEAGDMDLADDLSAQISSLMNRRDAFAKNGARGELEVSKMFSEVQEDNKAKAEELLEIYNQQIENGRSGTDALRAIQSYGYTVYNGQLMLNPSVYEVVDGGKRAFEEGAARAMNIQSTVVEAGNPINRADLERSAKRRGLTEVIRSVVGKIKNPALPQYAKVKVPFFYYSSDKNRADLTDQYSGKLVKTIADMERHEYAKVLDSFFNLHSDGESDYSARRKELYEVAKTCARQDTLDAITSAITDKIPIIVYDPDGRYYGEDLGDNLKRVKLNSTLTYQNDSGQNVRMLVNSEVDLMHVYIAQLYRYLMDPDSIIKVSQVVEGSKEKGEFRVDISRPLSILWNKKDKDEGPARTEPKVQQIAGENTTEAEENVEGEEARPVSSNTQYSEVEETEDVEEDTEEAQDIISYLADLLSRSNLDQNEYGESEVKTKLGAKATRGHSDPTHEAVVALENGASWAEAESIARGSRVSKDEKSLDYDDMYGDEATFHFVQGKRYTGGGILLMFDASDDPVTGKGRYRLATADDFQKLFASGALKSNRGFDQLFWSEDNSSEKIASMRTRNRNFNLAAKAAILAELINQNKDQSWAKIDFTANPNDIVALLGSTIMSEDEAAAEKYGKLSSDKELRIRDDFMDQELVPQHVFEAMRGMEKVVDSDRHYESDMLFESDEAGNRVTAETFKRYGATDPQAAYKAWETIQKGRALYGTDLFDYRHTRYKLQTMKDVRDVPAQKKKENVFNIYRTYIAGLSHYDQTVISGLRADDYIYLKAEPNNPNDPHAVAIYNSNGKDAVKIGYIPKNSPLKADLFFILSENRGKVVARITDVKGNAENINEAGIELYYDSYSSAEKTSEENPEDEEKITLIGINNAAKVLMQQIGQPDVYHFSSEERALLRGDFEITLSDKGQKKTTTLVKELDEQTTMIRKRVSELDKLKREIASDEKTVAEYKAQLKGKENTMEGVDLEDKILDMSTKVEFKKQSLDRLEIGYEQMKRRFEVIRYGIDKWIEPILQATNETSKKQTSLTPEEQKTEDLFRTIMDNLGVIYIFTPKNVSPTSGDTRSISKGSIGITSYEFSHDLYACHPYFLHMGESEFWNTGSVRMLNSIADFVAFMNAAKPSDNNTYSRQFQGYEQVDFDPKGNPIVWDVNQTNAELWRDRNAKVGREITTDYAELIIKDFESAKNRILEDCRNAASKAENDLERQYANQKLKEAEDYLNKIEENLNMGEDLEDLLWWHERYSSTFNIAALAWLDKNGNLLNQGLYDQITESFTQSLKKGTTSDSELAEALIPYLDTPSDVSISDLNFLRKYIRENYEIMFNMTDSIWEDAGYGSVKTNIKNIFRDAPVGGNKNSNLAVYTRIPGLDQFDVVLGRPINSMFDMGFELNVYTKQDGTEVRQIVVDKDLDWQSQVNALLMAITQLEIFQDRETQAFNVPYDPIQSYRFGSDERNHDLNNPNSKLSIFHKSIARTRDLLKNYSYKNYAAVLNAALTENIRDGKPDAEMWLDEFFAGKRNVKGLVLTKKEKDDLQWNILYPKGGDSKTVYNSSGEEIKLVEVNDPDNPDQTLAKLRWILQPVEVKYQAAMDAYAKAGYRVPGDVRTAKNLLVQNLAHYLVGDTIMRKVNTYGTTLADVLTAIKGQTDENLLTEDVFMALFNGNAIEGLSVPTIANSSRYYKELSRFRRQNPNATSTFAEQTDMSNNASPLYSFWYNLNVGLNGYSGKYKNIIKAAVKAKSADTFIKLFEYAQKDPELLNVIFNNSAFRDFTFGNTMYGTPKNGEPSVNERLYNALADAYQNDSVHAEEVNKTIEGRQKWQSKASIALKPDSNSADAKQFAAIQEWIRNGKVGPKPNPRTYVDVEGDSNRQFVEAILLTINFNEKDQKLINSYLFDGKYNELAYLIRSMLAKKKDADGREITLSDPKAIYENYTNMYYESGVKSKFEAAGRRLKTVAKTISNLTGETYTVDDLFNDLQEYGNYENESFREFGRIAENFNSIPKRYQAQNVVDKIVAMGTKYLDTIFKNGEGTTAGADEADDVIMRGLYNLATDYVLDKYQNYNPLGDLITNGISDIRRSFYEFCIPQTQADISDLEDYVKNNIRDYIALVPTEAKPTKTYWERTNPPKGDWRSLGLNRAGDETVSYEHTDDYDVMMAGTNRRRGQLVKTSFWQAYRRQSEIQRNLFDKLQESLGQPTSDAFYEEADHISAQRKRQLTYILSTFGNFINSAEAYVNQGVTRGNMKVEAVDREDVLGTIEYMKTLNDERLALEPNGILDIFRNPDAYDDGTADVDSAKVYMLATVLGYADKMTEAVDNYDYYDLTNRFYVNVTQITDGDLKVYGKGQWYKLLVDEAYKELGQYVENLEGFIDAVEENGSILLNQPPVVQRLYMTYRFAANMLRPAIRIKMVENDSYNDVADAVSRIVAKRPRASWKNIRDLSGENILRIMTADYDNDLLLALDMKGYKRFTSFMKAIQEDDIRFGTGVFDMLGDYYYEFEKNRTAEDNEQIRKMLADIFNEKEVQKDSDGVAEVSKYFAVSVDPTFVAPSSTLNHEQDAALESLNNGYFGFLNSTTVQAKQDRALDTIRKEIVRGADRMYAEDQKARYGDTAPNGFSANVILNPLDYADEKNFKQYFVQELRNRFDELAKTYRKKTYDEKKEARKKHQNLPTRRYITQEDLTLAANLYNLAVDMAWASKNADSRYNEIDRNGYLNVAEEIRNWICINQNGTPASEYVSQQLIEFNKHVSPDYEALKLASKISGFVRNNFTDIDVDYEMKQNNYTHAYEIVGLTENNFAEYRNAILTGNNKAIETAYKDIMNRVGKEMKRHESLWLKFRKEATAWRYGAMLLQPTTHTGNIVSTAMNWANYSLADAMTYAIEKGRINRGTLDRSEATSAIVNPFSEADKARMAKAKEVFNETKQYMFNQGKLGSMLREAQSVASSYIQKINISAKALEWEDHNLLGVNIFKQQFAEILKARGIEASQYDALDDDTKAKIASIAASQTEKILYRNLSTLSKGLNILSNTPVASFFINPILPFANIAGNLATQALQTSPIGLAFILYDISMDSLAKHTMLDADGNVIAPKGPQWLKEAAIRYQDLHDADPMNKKSRRAKMISQVTVGSAGMLFGFFANLFGYITAGDDDDKDVARYENANGRQKYSLKIGDKYISLTRLFPANFSILLGAKFADMCKNGEWKFGDAFYETFAENSFLSSIFDYLERFRKTTNDLSYKEYDNDADMLFNALFAYATSTMQQYVTQFNPGILKTLENIFYEDYQDKFFYNKESKIPYALQYVMSDYAESMWWTDYNRVDKRDMYGRKQESETLPDYLLRVLIGTYTTEKQNRFDGWLSDLADAGYADRVIFDDIKTSKQVEGQRMTDKEYEAYYDVLESIRYNIYDSLTDDDLFQSLSNERKAEIIEYMGKFANQAAANKVISMRGDDKKDGYYNGNENTGKGTVNLHNLKLVEDDKGNATPMVIYTIQDGDKWVNIPGVLTVDGKASIVSEDEAIKAYYESKANNNPYHLGESSSYSDAKMKADALMYDLEKYYASDKTQNGLASIIDLSDKTNDFEKFAMIRNAMDHLDTPEDFDLLEDLMDQFETYPRAVQNAALKDPLFANMYYAYTSESKLPAQEYYTMNSMYNDASGRGDQQAWDILADYLVSGEHSNATDYFNENKDGFKKVSEAAEAGVNLADWDEARDKTNALFNRGGRDTTSATSSEIEDFDKMVSSLEYKGENDILDLVFTQYDRDKLAQANADGKSTEDYFRVYDIKRAIEENDDLSPTEQRDALTTALRKEFNDEEVNYWSNLFKTYMHIPIDETVKDTMYNLGLSDSDSTYVSELFGGLEAINGYSTVRACQKVMALEEAFRLDDIASNLSTAQWHDILYDYMAQVYSDGEDKFRSKYPSYSAGYAYYKEQYRKKK